MASRFRIENIDDVHRIPDLKSAVMVMRDLKISTAGVKSLDDAKGRISQNFKQDVADEINKKNSEMDGDPMHTALKENEANRAKLTELFRHCDAFVRSLLPQVLQDLHKTFPDFEKRMKQTETDLTKSSCYILVAGETGAGKSSIINLLLGSRILPTSDLQCTANICELRKSDRRYYVLKPKRKDGVKAKPVPQMVQWDRSMSLEHFLEILAGHIQLVDQATEESAYEKIEIYWPFEYTMDNIVFVDTPGVGDNLNLSKSLQKYMDKTFGFIYVVNSAAAGGVHRDRLGRLLRAARERGDEDFDPSAALFVCNKHDLIKETEVDLVMEVTVEKLKTCYPGVQNAQVRPISAKQAQKTLEYDRGMLQHHHHLVNGVRDILPKIFHAQLAAHYRWLASVIKRTMYTLKILRSFDAKNIDQKEALLQEVKKQMDRLNKSAKDRICVMKNDMMDAMQGVILNIEKLIDNSSAELSMWGSNTCPQPEKEWKMVARKASDEIAARVGDLVNDWDERKKVVGKIKQEVLDKFKTELSLFEDQIQQVEGMFLDGGDTHTIVDFHHSMKIKSQNRHALKAPKKEKDHGSITLGAAIGDATSLNTRDAQVKKIFKDYIKSSQTGELMRQATMIFLKDLNKSTLTDAVKKYFTKFFREIDEISELIPKFLQSDRELIKTLTVEVDERENKMAVLYPELISDCCNLGSKLDMFYCRKLMKVDFPFDSFVIDKKCVGEGTFAKVFKAKRMSDADLVVALKVSKDVLRERTVSDVLLEHQTSRSLSHRNIIRYFGSSRKEVNRDIKFVMVLEYCHETLKNLIDRETEQAPSKAISNMQDAMLNMADLAQQMCSGLGYMHQKSIVHRDLKTDNILVTSDRIVKLSDLGLAKMGLAASKQVGSPVYMAPEILLGDDRVLYDVKADIYSLGVILWELWYGQDVASHIERYVTGSFESCIKRGLRPALTLKSKPPSLWSDVIANCWLEAPSKRRSCQDLDDFFQKFIQDFKK